MSNPHDKVLTHPFCYSLASNRYIYYYSASLPIAAIFVIWISTDDVRVNIALTLFSLMGWCVWIYSVKRSSSNLRFLSFQNGHWQLGQSFERSNRVFPQNNILRFAHFIYLSVKTEDKRQLGLFIWQDVVGDKALRQLSRQLGEYAFRNQRPK